MDPGRPDASIMKTFNPFLQAILAGYQEPPHSVYITGSALTTDFNPKFSDINSVFVLRRMDLGFLLTLAPLGKKYGKKGIAAPLIMTPAYIQRSLDVFPIEFLNLKLLHFRVLGEDEDLFDGIKINRTDLRCQCEREFKVKLMGLRQAYIRAAGDRRALADNMIASIPAYIPLIRAVLFLRGVASPLNNAAVLRRLRETLQIDSAAFQAVLELKADRKSLSLDELNTLFKDYYGATEKLGDMMDALAD